MPAERSPCPACTRATAKRPRSGKLRYAHRCPHGRPCSQGDPRWGAHSNGRPRPGSCAECEREHRVRRERARIPQHCGDPHCLCSGGQHVLCWRGRDRDQASRDMLRSLNGFGGARPSTDDDDDA